MSTLSSDLRIDALARAALRDPAAFDAYWCALFALESWHYVARDDWAAVDRGDKELAPSPFVGMLDDGPHLLAFTSGPRAGYYAHRNGLIPPNDHPLVLAMSPASSVRTATALGAQGVTGVAFNPGDVGIRCPVGQLEPLLRHHAGNDLDELAETARASGDVTEYLRAVFALPYWYLLLTERLPSGAPIPLMRMIDGKRHVFAFTSSERALAFAEERSEPYEVMRLPVADAAKVIRHLSAFDVHAVVLDQRQAAISLKAAAAEDALRHFTAGS